MFVLLVCNRSVRNDGRNKRDVFHSCIKAKWLLCIQLSKVMAYPEERPKKAC